MSYQPPFNGNWMTENRWLSQNDKPPPSIQNAVRFMYAGAAIQALSVILEIAAVRSAHPEHPRVGVGDTAHTEPAEIWPRPSAWVSSS